MPHSKALSPVPLIPTLSPAPLILRLPPVPFIHRLSLILRIAENDITVHIKAGATRNNSQQLLQASALVIKLINFCQNIASKAMDPVLNAPGHFKLSFLTCFLRQYKTKNRMMAKIRTKLESTNPVTMSVSREKRQLLSHASEWGKNC